MISACGGSETLRKRSRFRRAMTLSLLPALFCLVAAADFRDVSHSVLSADMDVFTDAGVSHFSEILFDLDKYQMFVGARDTIYRLTLDLKQMEKTSWEADVESVNLCKAKGQSESDCRNFVKVLVSPRNAGLFVCATHAFDPKCSWRDSDRISVVKEWVEGKGKCPYSPNANSTALMTSSGDYYIASAIDFSNNDPAVFRTSPSSGGSGSLLRTNQYNPMWLNRPDFVGSFETQTFVYFVFRETAMEATGCGVQVRSRIARVCKNDEGGRPKDNWSTFIKARLACAVPDDAKRPFYFDEVQDVHYVEGESVLYAAFTTPESALAGSAICRYDMSAVEEAFSGSFLVRSGPESVWKPRRGGGGGRSAFQCKSGRNADDPASSQFQLVAAEVEPTTVGPLYQEIGKRFAKLTVDPLAHVDRVHALFVVVRDEGVIKKLSFDPSTGQACLVEVLHPFDETARRPVIHKMAFTAATASVYLTTENGVLRVPAQRCSRFASEEECANAMDPYCVWDRDEAACAGVKENEGNGRRLVCPIPPKQPHDGWSSWTEWSTCRFEQDDKGYRRSSDAQPASACRCRTRDCPSSRCGDGLAGVEVTNCTRHGRWTSWSDWSGCSRSCDVGQRHRRRKCGNPEPAFGGATCVGMDTETHFCPDLPACPSTASSVSAAPMWSEWGACSARCGRGFRSRRGNGCCPIDYEACEGRECPRTRNESINFEALQRSCGDEDCRSKCWSEWSACSQGKRLRSRTADDVGESSFEEESCVGDGEAFAGSSAGGVVAACFIGFLLGTIFGGGAIYYAVRFRRSGGYGSPRYLSAKSNNLYVSLPMLDLKNKRLASNTSDFDTLRSTSTIRSKAGSSIYGGGGGTLKSPDETATIRPSRSNRNSRLINAAMHSPDDMFT